MKRERNPGNQALRTRQELPLAAGRLMKQGRKPTVEEVAKEAMVSRPTAYRYFRNIESLLVERRSMRPSALPRIFFEQHLR